MSSWLSLDGETLVDIKENSFKFLGRARLEFLFNKVIYPKKYYFFLRALSTLKPLAGQGDRGDQQISTEDPFIKSGPPHTIHRYLRYLNR